MPWKETCAMDERVRFMGEWLGRSERMVDLCRYYGISRKTGYKWVRRYEELGVVGLEEMSRAPLQHPNAVSEEMVGRVVQARKVYPRWGPKKLRAWLEKESPEEEWPSVSTFGNILRRRGLVSQRRRRRRVQPYGEPFSRDMKPNDVWCADFKGWFMTGDGSRCNPLTVTDGLSRYIIRCEGLESTDIASVRPVFAGAFREYGLPAVIRTEDGHPFASVGYGGLSRLSVWWVKLGILPERIAPGRPEQNGRHERMHRTLKEETAAPPAATLGLQQKAFDEFRRMYNEGRPHEALGQKTPGEIYRPSEREYREKPPEVEYPDRFVVRRVRRNGEIKWKGEKIFLSEVLVGEPVGFKQVDDRYWRVYFGPLAIAWLDDHQANLLKTTELPRSRKV